MSELKSSVNICFIGNFYKTFLFHEIGACLKLNGVGVYWLVTKSDQYDFLRQHYEADHILNINREFIHKENTIVDDFKLHELVYGDRVFKHEIENGLKFLTHIQRPVYDFLLRNKMRFVFGEVTWSHEVLLLRMCKQRSELNCFFLQCSDIRIPNSRCAFFADEGEYNMMQFDEPYSGNEVIRMEKPKYLKLINTMLEKNKSVLGRLGRLKRFFTGENIEKNDPNVIVNKMTRLKVAGEEEFNKTSYGFLKKKKLEDIEGTKFVFFGFHKQPEASIDVHGRYNEDQYLIVTNLWRLLPAGWKVVVKEHTNAIGDRSYSFYKRLLQFPNIILIDEKIDSKLLIARSELVVTVCGTMSYEAALMKKPSITLAKVFFNYINYCKFVSFSDLTKYESLARLVDELNSQPDNRIEFSRYLMKNSFEGYVSDSFTDAAVMMDENIQKLAKAFMKLIDRYGAI